MSKPRVTTAEQDKQLADWWWALHGMGTVRDKAKEYGISVSAFYDAVARGLQLPTAGQRFKLAEYQRAANVPRGADAESNQSDSIALSTAATEDVA